MSIQDVINLSSLKSRQDVLQAVDIILQVVYDNKKNIKRDQIINLFTLSYENIINPSSPPISKFYTIMIYKEITQIKQTKILSLLSGSQLFKQMYDYALNVDPKKPSSQKGKDLFKNDPKAGNQFMILILECFMVWGQRFTTNKNKQPTKFRKTLNSLIQNKIVLPKNPTYFQSLGKPEGSKIQQPPPNKPQMQPRESVSTPIGSQQVINIGTDIRFAFNKIQGLIGVLENAQTSQGIQQQINKYHSIFVKYNSQYSSQQFTGRVLSQKEQTVQLYFKIKNFFDEEQKLYNKFGVARDYSSLRTSLLMQYQQDFGQGGPSKNEIPSKSKMINSQSQISRPPISTTTVAQPKLKKQQSKKQKDSPPIRQNNIMKNSVSKNAIGDFFEKLQSRSKSPALGFKLIKQSLQKQKKNIKIHPPRGHIKQSRGSKIENQTANSILDKKNSLFTNPPNPSAPMINYQGNFVSQNKQLKKILYELKKDQGHRKFKVSNFRQKGILYENQHIQIGYKSQQIYEQVDEYNSLIGIQLFIGNKTESDINQFTLQFLGDENTLLYSNPREVKTEIQKDFQYRHELIIIPKSIPYHFMNMRVSYKYKGLNVYTTVALPSSILKLATYLKTPMRQLDDLWKDSTILRTQDFKLSHRIIPNSLLKQIPQLIQLSKYNDFLSKGSITDYKLTCQVLLMNLFEGILRIIIRPDMKVVLQIGIIEGSQDAQEYFKFYLQTLQFVLSQTEW